MDRGWTVGWLSSTFVLALSVLILAFPASAAATSRPVAGQPATESPPATWAFAGSQVVNQSTGNATATVSQAGEFDWATVFSERSTGPFGLTLIVQRGMWTQYAYRLCAPNCAAPTYSLQASVSGHEWSQEFLNLSLQAPLPGGGTAIGLVNASVIQRAALNTSSQVSGNAIATTGVASTGTSSASYFVAFAPAVPLAPTSPSAGATWTGSSTAQSANGGWSRVVSTSYTGLPSPDARITARQNLTAGGLLPVTGTVHAPLPIGSGESVLPVNVAAGIGPFRLLDGVVLDVVGASFFAAAATSATPSTGVIETPTGLDYDSTVGTHLGIVAAALQFQPTVAAPVGSAPAPPGATVAAFEPPTWTIQATPEPVSAALGFFAQHGIAPAQTSIGVTTPTPVASFVPIAWVVAGAAVVGAVVALGIRWRRPTDGGLAVPAEQPELVGTRAGGSADGLEPGGPIPSTPNVRDPFDDLL